MLDELPVELIVYNDFVDDGCPRIAEEETVSLVGVRCPTDCLLPSDVE